MPYSGSYTIFPYSMEWNDLSLRALMSGPTNFDWSSLETLLNTVASRGHQTVFRVYLDYQGKSTGLSQYLLDAGLSTHSYTDTTATTGEASRRITKTRSGATNTSTSDWSVTDEESVAARFYRVVGSQ